MFWKKTKLQEHSLGLCIEIWTYSGGVKHNENKLKNQDILHKT